MAALRGSGAISGWSGPAGVPVIVVDRANAQPIEVRVTSRDGRPIGWLDAR